MTTTRQYTESELETIAKVEANLMDGRTFDLHAASARSIFGYQPPSSARNYAKALAHLADGARQGDRQARLVSEVIGKLPIHSTPGESVAKLYDAAGAALERGYFDTVGNASPEPGRRSDHEHSYTLRDRLELLNTITKAAGELLPGAGSHGWCVAHLMEREGLAI